jgi:hypothetical protein
MPAPVVRSRCVARWGGTPGLQWVWPSLNQLEGAPLKLRLGGDFDFHALGAILPPPPNISTAPM